MLGVADRSRWSRPATASPSTWAYPGVGGLSACGVPRVPPPGLRQAPARRAASQRRAPRGP
eukprot:901346-Lingulodinium_polyedra.AAC.1